MHTQILKLLSGLGLCLMVNGCGIRDTTFYIPVDNQAANDAKPLSKDDVIRVVVPQDITQYITYSDRYDEKKNHWKWGTLVISLSGAKEETEKRLQNLEYTVVDTGDHPSNDGHPTVIALVDSAPIEGSETTETHTWDAPVFTDDMGRTTLSEKQGVTITHKTYYYKIQLVRPEGMNNSLFECNNNNQTYGYCIAPVNPSNYKTIFTSYATISTDNPNFLISISHLTTAVFYNYPNMMGKKWVYFTNTGYTPLYATDPNAPKPTDKK